MSPDPITPPAVADAERSTTQPAWSRTPERENRSGEVFGTREISDAERALYEKYADILQPLPRDAKPIRFADITRPRHA